MKKPGTLRDCLAAEVPYLRKNPDKLSLFITDGSIQATMAGTSVSYVNAYTLEIVVFDYAKPSETLFAPILEWLKTNQPEMLLNTNLMEKGFKFEAELLNNQSADIVIKLALTERVIMSVEDGVRHAVYADEPPIFV